MSDSSSEDDDHHDHHDHHPMEVEAAASAPVCRIRDALR